MSDGERREGLAPLFALIVHDLRNPVATISANVSFVRETCKLDRDADEALADVTMGVDELIRGLEQLAWIGRWLGDAPAMDAADGDGLAAVAVAARDRDVEVELAPVTATVRGAAALTRLVELLLSNAAAHAPRGSVRLTARVEDGALIVEVCDAGRALAPELRPIAFTSLGQQQLKAQTHGRYGRVAALLAARALADALGATLEADGVDGAAVFRIRCPVIR